MTHHSFLVERIGARPPGDRLTCSVRMDEAPRSRKSARSSLSGAPRVSVGPRNAPGDVCFYVGPQGRQHFNFRQRLWLYLPVPIAVTPGMTIELETLAVNLLTRLTQERDYRAAMGVTCKRLRRLASRLCAECLLTEQSPAWVMQRSSPRPLVHSPLLPTRVAFNEPSLGSLVTQISPLKREAMIPTDGPGSINFQRVVDNEGGHGQALRRPRRSPPVTAVAKTRGSLPSGAADIGHIGPPLDRARERRDLR
jgi:hypothetical protein